MRTAPVTEETIAKNRKVAREQPTTGLPELARSLLEFGWRIDRERPLERIPYFEEATDIYRSLLAGGADGHLAAAAHAISSLGLQYSLAHVDDLSLSVKHEAAVLARRINLQRTGAKKEIQILGKLAHGLAEAGQFAQAVTAQLEVVGIYRATGSQGSYPSPDSVMWSLLDLAIYLDLAGQTDASLEIEREALTLKRRMTEDDQRRLPGLVLWAAGVSLRFTDTDHPQEARDLLDEAIAACDQLPVEGDRKSFSFGFHQAMQAALFARSGARDERANLGQAIPIDVSSAPQTLQPVHGLSFHHWAFSVRQTYRTGLEAINTAISAIGDPPAHDPARLAELGSLVRRRNIRESVLFNCLSQHFLDKIIPALGESVALERRLLAADPAQGPRRLIRSLTDQAIGHLVTCSNAMAGNALREARDLYVTVDN